MSLGYGKSWWKLPKLHLLYSRVCDTFDEAPLHPQNTQYNHHLHHHRYILFERGETQEVFQLMKREEGRQKELSGHLSAPGANENCSPDPPSIRYDPKIESSRPLRPKLNLSSATKR